MVTDHHVKVEYKNNELLIDENQKDLTLTAETPPIHSVVWYFEGIDEFVAKGYHPSIMFTLSTSSVMLYSGPFIDLCRTRTSVIACGNNGIGDPVGYSYRAVLQQPMTGEVIRSQNYGSIDNQVSIEQPAVVQVRAAPEDSHLLVVEPEIVSLSPGQSILWSVEATPDETRDWYPRLLFSNGDPYFGPFTSIEARSETLLGMGSQATGKFHYLFQMISVQEQSVLRASSPDPEIDSEGDPSEPGGTPDMQDRAVTAGSER